MSLVIDNLSYQVQKVSLLNNISLTVQRGTIHGLLGPNGAGKTTLFSQIIGLTPMQEGKISLDSIDITKQCASKRIERGLSFLPQHSCLFEEMSVLDNVLVALEAQDLKESQSLLKEKALFVLNEMNISSLALKKAKVLSGGQKRRCEFARLLACKPSYALLDEPFAGVDPLSIKEIAKQIHYLTQKNIGILISDHHVEETLTICSSATVLYQGNILASGSPKEIREDSQVKRLYLGAGTHT